MPFVELEKKTQGGYSVATADKPCISAPKDAKNNVHIYFRLPRSLVYEVWPKQVFNDGRSVRLGFLEGVDGEAGFLMLVHRPNGYTFTAPAFARDDGKPSVAGFTSKMGFTFFKHYQPVSVPQPLTPMEYSIDGPAVLLQVPEWFSYMHPQPIARPTMQPVLRPVAGRPPMTHNVRNK